MARPDPADIPLALYLHLPWCVKKCPYCDFNSHPAAADSSRRDAQQREYIDAMCHDMLLQAEAGVTGGRRVETVFIGGGTPSLFAPADIGRLLDTAAGHWSFATDAEITMEANPGAVEHGSFKGYRSVGVNRVSIGGQSFDARQLKLLGRLHGPEEIADAVHNAQQAGFERINVDLMYGLPEQTREQALADVRAAIALDVSHISYYQLTLEPNTQFHAFPPDLPDPDDVAEMGDAASNMFAEAGLHHYEVSALARNGDVCQHNLNYWQFADYLAVGAGAHGKLTTNRGVFRYMRPVHPRSYIDAMGTASDFCPTRPLTTSSLIFEFMLNALRLKQGFALSMFETRTGCDRGQVELTLASAVDRGLLTVTDSEFCRPTALGERFVNDLQALFLVDSEQGQAIDSGVGGEPVIHRDRGYA